MFNGRKLKKSKTDAKLCGVCGGIAEFQGIDSVWIRILWLVAVLIYGFGIVPYIILAIAMPDE